jgi:NADPH:quinone reductase-like Zn-dependent oxidoreductase
MRAVRFHAYGPASELRVDEVPDPTPGPGEVLVRVRAAAVNHWDIDMRNGTSRLPLTLPHTPGIEVSGEVAAVGEGVTGVAVGARVMPRFLWPCTRCQWCLAGQENHCETVRVLGATQPGGYAEYVVVPASALIPLADATTYESAAALQGTYAPVWHALKERLDLQPGTTILINAAGSGVGSAAIQLATLLGARVFASAGSDEKLDRARRDGAEATINYRREDLGSRAREVTAGRGVDAVLDCVGGAVFEASLHALAWNGRLATIGAHGGEAVRLDLIPLFRNQWSIIGSVNCTPRDIDEVARLHREGTIHPTIHRTYGLEEAARAHDDLEARRHYGKLVLMP